MLFGLIRTNGTLNDHAGHRPKELEKEHDDISIHSSHIEERLATKSKQKFQKTFTRANDQTSETKGKPLPFQ